MSRPLRVGAVMYDPKVSVIWEIIADFFQAQACPIDISFYNTYARQVSALVDDAIDLAWNSPLAWLDSQRRTAGRCRAIAMRDTDRDRVTYLVGRTEGPVRSLADLRGRTLAVGASDSPQATLIPLGLLRKQGIDPRRDVDIKRFDVMVGKHGDHVGGELDAFRSLERGEAQVSAMLDRNWETWTQDGTIDPRVFEIKASTERFDHCVFTAREALDAEAERRWLEALYSMQYDNPAHRKMMDLEGLKAWMPGRVSGFGPLSAAVEAERFFESGAASA